MTRSSDSYFVVDEVYNKWHAGEIESVHGALRQLAERQREAIIEECAKVCERVKDNAHWTDGLEAGAEACTAAIRTLISPATLNGKST